MPQRQRRCPIKPTRGWSCLIVVFLLWAAPGLVQTQAARTEQLGQVHFPVACSADVQQEFDRAVALLHSFAFDPSAKAFGALAQKDPSCGMAHWGVAMTRLGNPFNWPPGSQAIQEGWAAVEQAKAVGGKTAREQAYIAAIEVFYKDAEKIDHRTHALAYEHAMEQLSRRYPDDRGRATLVGTAGLLSLYPRSAATAPPPETTPLWLAYHSRSLCHAPLYVAQELLQGEGFTEVRYVKLVGYADVRPHHRDKHTT